MDISVSLIVTTHDRPDALAKVLDALEDQTRFPREVIVADDGSGPDTARLIRERAKRHPRPILHVRQEHEGFRAARIRNRGLRVASGNYIVLLDGDSLPERFFIADHIRLAESGCFVQGKRVLADEVLTRTLTPDRINSPLERTRLLLSRHVGNRHHLLRWPSFPARVSGRMEGIRSCNMGFFRDDIVAVNGFNEDFVGWGREDSELVARLFRWGLKRKEHPFMAMCFHLWHPENDRSGLERNDLLLKRTLESHDIVCPNGLVRR